METAIIFGHTGQDGFYLKQILEFAGIKVYGVSRTQQDIECSLESLEQLKYVFGQYKPRYIFNFAALSTTKHNALLDNHTTISTGSCNLLEAARITVPEVRIFLSGSGLQFENNERPIDEDCPLAASSPYVVERNYTYYLAKYYRSRLGMDVYYGFFFTHDSPRRQPQHMTKKIALAAKAIAAGEINSIEIGDLSVRKEYLFAGDAMRAVWLLVNQQNIYEVVIGSGQAYSIEEYLAACFKKVKLDYTKYVHIKPNFVAEYKVLVSNPARLKSLGWQPQVTFKDLVNMMMGDV